MARFEKDDVLKLKYKSIAHFIQMFDAACCDIAKRDK